MPACSDDGVVAVLGQQLQAKLDLADPLEGLPPPTTTAPVEELTPLQQLLVMCGQEVGRVAVAGMACKLASRAQVPGH